MYRSLFVSFLFLFLFIACNASSKEDIAPILPELIKINKGSFYMGSNDYYEYEKPLHKVNITKDFYVGKYEVTFNEYDKFCEDTSRTKPDDEGWGRGKRPVINVSWEDAKEYTLWLSKKTGDKYRLLSEAEWEYAARGGNSSKYSFGSNENELENYAWYDKNTLSLGVFHSNYGTNPVGEKLPNSYNIYDIHGNVWEYCEDWYIDGYHETPIDGTAYKKRTQFKVIRGGSWNFNALNQRSAARGRAYLNYRAHDLGFRIAKDVE
ncbi:formylglycine-generating enzyme family protein [Aliarcobacter butzleri]